MEERNALVFSQKSKWITTLFAAFQDEENLYLVMEYVSGGSFRALLNNRDEVMTEEEAKFYISEMILALEELHRNHYIHRDIKPENYLLDSKGHIKLADFGSCIRISESSTVTSHVTVGTPGICKLN
jgi:serine/threonine protein kinase